MKARAALAITCLLVAGAAGCSTSKTAKPSSEAAKVETPTAPFFSDIGSYHHPITTDSKLAQRYFDQGLTLAYAFNHAEAVRSFHAGAAADPNCAMCYWGASFALGTNINAPMAPENAKPAWEALQKARANAKRASKHERAYIDALSVRYAKNPPKDRSALDKAYAEEMRKVMEKYPDDLDAATICAEAAMDTMPWDYYLPDGSPKPLAKEIFATLEGVLARDPNHIGAIHFYIHAVEASSTPERAEAPADRLVNLISGAGHLVHMPSHIYYRVGRYDDAAKVNVLAAKADESYITQCKAQGFYPALYYPHNVHFLAAAAAEDGRSKLSIESARKLYDLAPDSQFEEYPVLEDFRPVYWYALARFGKWNEILKLPAPKSTLRFSTGMWHYVRGLASVKLGRVATAKKERALLASIEAEPKLIGFKLMSGSSADQLLGIAGDVLDASIARAKGERATEIAALEKAVAMQDSLPYTEPPPWYFPVRHALGDALLRAGRTKDAEAVYRADLEKNRGNGWALYGLAEALRAQGKTAEADAVMRDFTTSWARADTKPTTAYR